MILFITQICIRQTWYYVSHRCDTMYHIDVILFITQTWNSVSNRRDTMYHTDVILCIMQTWYYVSQAWYYVSDIHDTFTQAWWYVSHRHFTMYHTDRLNNQNLFMTDWHIYISWYEVNQTKMIQKSNTKDKSWASEVYLENLKKKMFFRNAFESITVDNVGRECVTTAAPHDAPYPPGGGTCQSGSVTTAWWCRSRMK